MEARTLGEKSTTLTVVGFGRRVIALFIDGVTIFFASMLIAVVIVMGLTLISFIVKSDFFVVERVTVISGLIVSLVYYLRAWTRSGRTVGNIVMDIKVVGEDGNPPSLGKAILRYIGYIISGLIAGLGFLWVAFDGKRQGLHDKIAGTYVVFTENPLAPQDATTFEPTDPRKGWIWLLVWIFVAIVSPTFLFVSLFFLGPFVDKFLYDLIQGLFGG
ncbi:MAG: RDD family protein [Anaerolineales bacterium]